MPALPSFALSLRHGALSGSLASLLSAAALALCGWRETGSAFAAVNAVSHWLWGDQAARRDDASLRHTLVGYVIHHCSAMFWGVLFERYAARILDRRRVASTVAAAAGATAVACFTDYQLTPHRLQPGYEMRLSRPSLLLVYGAFGIGLAAGALWLRRR